MSAAQQVNAPAGPRHARLFVSRVDPWSTMKTAFMLSLGLAVVLVVAIILLWVVLAASGIFDAFNTAVNDVGGQSASSFDIGGVLSFGRIFGFALLLAAFEIVLTSALATLMAALYNITVGFTGGVEVTLSEDG